MERGYSCSELSRNAAGFRGDLCVCTLSGWRHELCVCVCVCRFPLRFHSILLHSPLVVIFKMPPVFKCFCFPSWFCHFLSFTLHLRWVITLSISSHHVASLAFILHLRPPKTLFHLPPSPHCIFSFSSSSLWLYYSLQLASVHCRISDVDFSE